MPVSAQNRLESVEFDSLFTKARISLRVGETDVVTPLPMSYEQYRDLRIASDLRKAFIDETIKMFKAAAAANAGEGIAIDVPFRIKSKTFRRIFGGDNIGLRVQGSITIDGKYRRQKFDELQAANQRNTNNNFNIDMTQRFTIAGKIGEKVQVDVNQDSERLFDFENSLKLTYTGDKDEIVQKVEAGNVSLSLGTRLATFSGQNKGLFGLKTEAKVGALKLTGIASLERGQKNKQRPNENARRTTWSEKDFLQNVYFWVTNSTVTDSAGTVLVSNYRENYRRLANRTHVLPDIQLSDIELWVSTTETGSQQGVETANGAAVSMQNYSRIDLPEAELESNGEEEITGLFRRLQVGTDYDFRSDLGYIRLRTPLQSNVALACAFRTANGDEFGQMVPVDNNVRLVLLKPRVTSPTSSTWSLMFRHVYSVQATNINPENFSLEIIRGEDVGGQPENGPPGDTRTYLSFFDFDLEGANGTGDPDGVVDDYEALLDPVHGEIHFLDLTPFDPSGYVNPFTGEQTVWRLDSLDSQIDSGGYLAPELYTIEPTRLSSLGRKWRFQTEYQGSTAQFDLGPLVLEGSEEVTLNGQRLNRGADYTIDYLSGQLKILNEAAKAPNADLEITYESGQVFQLDRKTLLGARAEYELWQDSYIGGMMLHLNEKSLDQRVRIGNEPIRNTLYDLNSQLKFKPNFLTGVADRLPLVRTNVESELVLDGEVAKVFPNPNSLSNDATGDNNGVAFIDDFEASRRSVPLGMLRKNWTISSIPVDSELDSLRGRIRWWNPRPEDQVRVQDVYPERETNSQVADRLQSIVMEFVPDSSDGAPERSWGGVMRYLGAGYEDQSRAQFLEFWIQLPPESRAQGELVIDLGAISEDALPNDSMDSEDRPDGEVVQSPRREYGNGVLSQDEDTGIDGIPAADPADSAYWNGPTRPPVPSWDDYHYDIGSNDYRAINGTEGSLRGGDESSSNIDSEDLDGNRSLDQTNNYFSYTIDLSYTNPLIVGGQDRWRLFRIPIDSDDPSVKRVVGNPSLTDIRFARMYFKGMADSTRIQIVQNDIVTNEWQPIYVDQDSTEFVSVAVINNHENPQYTSPPGVQGEIDPITNLRQREQSLVLHVESLQGVDSARHTGLVLPPAEFFTAKNLYQQLNMIEYKRMKMFVHGGGTDEALFPDTTYQIILRLGTSFSNTNQNYYDIVKTVHRGWDSRNTIDVAMNDLSILSAWRSDETREDYDSSRAATYGRYAVLMDSALSIDDSLVVFGRPSLQSIGFIALGVRLKSKYRSGNDDEIWVDELRVSDIYKDPGTAGEFAATLKIADLLTMGGSYTKRDADFHNVNTRTGDQRTSETYRGSLTVQMQKFGLENYGFALPVSANYTESTEIPKYVPGTDARVDQSNPDTAVVAESRTWTYTASYAKSGNSPNPIVRWTAEKLRLSWDHSLSKRKDYQTLYQTQKTTNTRADYTFPTASGRGLAPFWFLNGVPLLSEIGNPHLHYKPRSLTGNLSARRTEAERQTRTGLRTISPDFSASGSGSVAFDLTETVSTSMTQTYGWTLLDPILFDRNGDGQIDSTVNQVRSWTDVASVNRRDLLSETWGWNNTYSPRFASWFAPTATYTSAYSWQKNQRNNNYTQSGLGNIQNQQTVSNSANLGGDVSLDLKNIFGSGGGARDRGRRREAPREEPKRTAAKNDSTGSDSTAVEEVAERGPGISPLKILGKSLTPVKTVLFLFDPFQVGYDNSKTHSLNNVTGPASLDYRLGWSQKPGTEVPAATDGSVQLTVQGANSETNDYNVRSGIRLSRDIRTTFSWNLRDSETHGNTSNGFKDQTYFWLANDKGLATEIPFADVTLDWSGFERISFLSKAARTVALNSGLSNRLREDWQSQSSNITTRTYSRSWSPLVGVSISWLNSIDSQIRLNSQSSFTNSVLQGNMQRSSTKGANATVSYTLRTGFRLPVPLLGAMRLENSTVFSLNVDYSTNLQERTQPTSEENDVKWTTQRDEVSWSFQPGMQYTFSSSVRGGAQLQYQQVKDKITDKGSKLIEFGINVNIQIRG
ncbi:MAG: cell surface protein SprA [Calditrichaeota bacterium]|nr:cell surface protein SprA [Calditrichota bacterium]MCB9369616.1 cell surface protein SprA [Calditrichota bacterium]